MVFQSFSVPDVLLDMSSVLYWTEDRVLQIVWSPVDLDQITGKSCSFQNKGSRAEQLRAGTKPSDLHALQLPLYLAHTELLLLDPVHDLLLRPRHQFLDTQVDADR